MKYPKLLSVIPPILSFLFFLPQTHAETTIAPLSSSKPVVISDGKNVWPPKGPGCDEFVRCCEAGEKKESSAMLMCQLTVSMPPVDCVKGLKDFKQYLVERNVAAPKECGSSSNK
jgi:hypothetical protein